MRSKEGLVGGSTSRESPFPGLDESEGVGVLSGVRLNRYVPLVTFALL